MTSPEAAPCPTCQGYNRSTTDMVCMMCGRDYTEDNPVPGLGWFRLMEAWREQCKEWEAALERVNDVLTRGSLMVPAALVLEAMRGKQPDD